MYNISHNKKQYKTPAIKVKEIHYGKVMIDVASEIGNTEAAKQTTTDFNTFSFEEEDDGNLWPKAGK